MIADISQISMSDGAHLNAMEVYPGREGLMSLGLKQRWVNARVLDRKIESHEYVVCLLLGNGQKLTGSRDQMVAVCREKSVRFTPLSDVAIGDRLRGERAGMPVVVNVIGLGFDSKPVRLVGFELDHGKNFVADGVLCR